MEFIFCEQNWKDKDDKIVVTHTEVMEKMDMLTVEYHIIQMKTHKFYLTFMLKIDVVIQVFAQKCLMPSNVFLHALIP